MCQKCVDLVKKHLPHVAYSRNSRKIGSVLVGLTCFPFGDPEKHLEPQLKMMARRYKKRQKQHKSGWERKEYILVHDEMDQQFENGRATREFWDMIPDF